MRATSVSFKGIQEPKYQNIPARQGENEKNFPLPRGCPASAARRNTGAAAIGSPKRTGGVLRGRLGFFQPKR